MIKVIHDLTHWKFVQTPDVSNVVFSASNDNTINNYPTPTLFNKRNLRINKLESQIDDYIWDHGHFFGIKHLIDELKELRNER